MRHCGASRQLLSRIICPTHLEILNEIVEHPQSIRVLGILHVVEGSDFGSLTANERESPTLARTATHLERDVFIAEPDLELLLSDNVLSRPLRVVLPAIIDQRHPPREPFPTHFVISLSLTIRLSSSINNGPIHTARCQPTSRNPSANSHSLSFLINESFL